MFPDGGFSRLGLYADLPPEEVSRYSAQPKCVRFADPIPKSKKPLTIPFRASAEETAKNFASGATPDFASQAFGAVLVSATNEHYGPAAQVISPFPPIHMFDGLESARSRNPGHSEQVVIQLGAPTRIGLIELDYTFFVNNNPLYVQIEGLSEGRWIELVPKNKSKPFAGNLQRFCFAREEVFAELKLTTYPDGGINRVRAWAP
jgi:allantoicase